MVFHLMTDPTPDEFFMTTNMKAEHGDLVLCLITEPESDISLYQKGSQSSKDILTIAGLMMLQEPVYIGELDIVDQKQLVVDVIHETKDEIVS